MKSEKFTVTYTNKDIMDKLESLDDKITPIVEKLKTDRRLIYASFGFTLFVLSVILSTGV